MTKKSEAGEAVEAAAGAPEEVSISLTDFCARLSESVKRPELINAFDYTCRAGGMLSGLPSEFQAAFDKFINKPV